MWSTKFASFKFGHRLLVIETNGSSRNKHSIFGSLGAIMVVKIWNIMCNSNWTDSNGTRFSFKDVSHNAHAQKKLTRSNKY